MIKCVSDCKSFTFRNAITDSGDGAISRRFDDNQERRGRRKVLGRRRRAQVGQCGFLSQSRLALQVPHIGSWHQTW